MYWSTQCVALLEEPGVCLERPSDKEPVESLWESAVNSITSIQAARADFLPEDFQQVGFLCVACASLSAKQWDLLDESTEILRMTE